MPALHQLVEHLTAEHVAALSIGIVACVFDLRTRRIPNALTLGGAVAAFSYALLALGITGFGRSLAGWLVGLAIFLPFFLLGGLGAGDVKLQACLGAWLGPAMALHGALYSAIAGGVLALIVALATGYLRTAVDNLYSLFFHFRVVGVRPYPELTLERGKGPRLPYAVPIAAGAAAAIWLH